MPGEATAIETPDGIRMRDFALNPINDTAPKEGGRSRAIKPDGFWSKYVRLIVEEDDCRDHLALERTFLAYMRTASAYAQFGVLVSQLFRLSDGEQVSAKLKIGNAVGASTIAVAIILALTGAAYFMKQQNGLVKGIILSRGYEVVVAVTLSFVLLCIILGLLAAAE